MSFPDKLLFRTTQTKFVNYYERLQQFVSAEANVLVLKYLSKELGCKDKLEPPPNSLEKPIFDIYDNEEGIKKGGGGLCGPLTYMAVKYALSGISSCNDVNINMLLGLASHNRLTLGIFVSILQKDYYVQSLRRGWNMNGSYEDVVNEGSVILAFYEDHIGIIFEMKRKRRWQRTSRRIICTDVRIELFDVKWVPKHRSDAETPFFNTRLEPYSYEETPFQFAILVSKHKNNKYINN